MTLDKQSARAGFIAGRRSMIAAIENERVAFRAELAAMQTRLDEAMKAIREMCDAIDKREAAREERLQLYRQHAIEDGWRHMLDDESMTRH